MSRFTGVLAASAAVLAFSVPQQASAVNSPVFSWVVDCANPGNQYAPVVTTMPTGKYLVTVQGVCSFGFGTTHSLRVSTCGVSPLPAGPCVDTGASVNDIPGATCIVGAGPAHAQTCPAPGAYVPGCGGSFTVTVEGQCLIGANLTGVVDHTNPFAPLYATVVDSGHADNVGAFVVTAVRTPL